MNLEVTNRCYAGTALKLPEPTKGVLDKKEAPRLLAAPFLVCYNPTQVNMGQDVDIHEASGLEGIEMPVGVAAALLVIARHGEDNRAIEAAMKVLKTEANVLYQELAGRGTEVRVNMGGPRGGWGVYLGIGR